MPYRPHTAYPSPYGAAPTGPKPRPSAAWFGVGGVLVLVAIIFFAVAVSRFVHTVAHTDARFPASGSHQVILAPHQQKAVFVQTDHGRFHCNAVDGTGAAVQVSKPRGSETYGSWRWVATIETGDGNLTFTCSASRLASPADVRIAPIPSGGMVLQFLLIGIVLPLALGGGGLVILLVTTILWISRAPRPTFPAGPPGPPWPGYPPPAR
jgi:hypothetical protein